MSTSRSRVLVRPSPGSLLCASHFRCIISLGLHFVVESTRARIGQRAARDHETCEKIRVKICLTSNSKLFTLCQKVWRQHRMKSWKPGAPGPSWILPSDEDRISSALHCSHSHQFSSGHKSFNERCKIYKVIPCRVVRHRLFPNEAFALFSSGKLFPSLIHLQTLPYPGISHKAVILRYIHWSG